MPGVCILRNRLVAFLDVLGFGNMLQSMDVELLHEKYSRFIDDVKTMTFYQAQGDRTGRTNFAHAQIVSDSMILVSNEVDDIYNVNNFVAAVSFLLEKGLISRLFLRGAIAHGDFLLDVDRQIFLSKALSEAVKYEGQQEWTGCAIMDSAKTIVLESAFGEKTVREGIVPNKELPLVKYGVPLKENKSDEKWCVNFTFFLPEKLLLESAEWLIAPKKDHFLQYLEFLNELPYQEHLLSKDFFPAKGFKAMKTRSGMRIQFIDADGKPCQPDNKQVQLTAVGRWRD